jgi:HTH-type transcriptional regulator/antitoxin HigA
MTAAVDARRTYTDAFMNAYLALVQVFPLVQIGCEADLDAAIAVIDQLTDRPVRSEAEEAYLGVLTDLVEMYENAHVAIPQRTGVDAVRFLMEANGLRQADLVLVLGRRSLVSELLHGKRRLALSHIRKLAEFFHVSPATFIDDAPADRVSHAPS